MMFSKQKTFCNICGIQMFVEIAQIGKFDGSIRVKMDNGPFTGKYKLLSIIGLPFTEDELPNSEGIIDKVFRHSNSLKHS